MADSDQEFLWAFGMKISKSKMGRIPLCMGPPETIEDPPDILDDDYWRWHMHTKPVTGLLRIEELSRTLQAEADREPPFTE